MFDDLQHHQSRSGIDLSAMGRLAFFIVCCRFFWWASGAEVDQISRAQGAVIPSSRIQVVQAEEKAVVKHLHTSLGERVTRGDVLIEFEDTGARGSC